MITQQEIAAFVEQTGAVCEMATVAPWSWGGDVLTSHWTNVISVFDNEGGASFSLEIDESDKAFIAYSRTALPRAIEIIREQAARIEKLERGKAK